MSYFVIIKGQILYILWYVCKQTFVEECIKVLILMKLECKIGLCYIGNIVLNNDSKGDVRATNLKKVAVYRIIHRSADRCQECQIHFNIRRICYVFDDIANS